MQWEKLISSGIRMPFYQELWLRGWNEEVPRLFGCKESGDWLFTSERQVCQAYFGGDTEIKIFKDWFEKNIDKPNQLMSLIKKLHQNEEKLLRYCRRLYFTDYCGASRFLLFWRLKKFIRLFKRKYGPYAIVRLTDLAMEDLLPKFFPPIIKEDWQKLVDNSEFGDFTRDRLAFLQILKNIRTSNIQPLFAKSNAEVMEQLCRFHPEIYYQIEKYAKDFAWVPVSHHVQPLNLDVVMGMIRTGLADATTAEELEDILSKRKKVTKWRAELTEKYNLTERHLRVLEFVRKMNAYNELRKAGHSKAVFLSYPLFQAIADRLNIDVVSLRQLLAEEMVVVLRRGSVSSEIRKIILDRLEFFVCLLRDGELKNFGGQEAKDFYDREVRPFLPGRDVKEIKGTSAMPGKVRGKVRLVRLESQAELVQEGEILVSSMTDPDMVPAMKKAAAIVTDEGGMLCHAAIISRELKKPCVIGTKIATQVLRDGDMVEVDAERGIIRKLNGN